MTTESDEKTAVISATREEAQAIIETWLTKAYPRGWQRAYVARGIVNDLAALRDQGAET